MIRRICAALGFAGVAAGIVMGCGTDTLPSAPDVDAGPADSGGNPATTKYALSGTVAGLLGSGLVLQNNAGDDITVNANGSFAFPTPLGNGSAYAVTVKKQPTNLSQTCTVTNGSGTFAGANVTSVAVVCETNKYPVGGTVTGLIGSGLVLRSEGGEVSVPADGAFTFPTTLADGATFTVSVKTAPSGPAQTCTVSGGSGKLAGGPVTSVLVNCSTNTYAVGGEISGLEGTGLVLQNNAGDDLPLNVNGTFAFSTALTDLATYAVTVKTQPANKWQTCAVTNGIGSIASSAVTNVSVVCTTNTYQVKATVSGLAGTGLVLRNNGADDLTISNDGTFAFDTPLASGASYLVSILTQPSNKSQTCTVTSGSGNVAGADVTDVAISCVTNEYSISGTLSGWTSGTVVLQNNAGDDINVSANGGFKFNTKVASGASYVVTTKTSPAGQYCSVTAGSGTVTSSDITNVKVTCATVACSGGATLLSASPSGGEVVCDHPANSVCEQDFETLCPAGWGLCSWKQHLNRRADWSYSPGLTGALGEIYCRGNGVGAGHFTLGPYDTPPMSSHGTNLNCGFGSSRASCTTSYGCNETSAAALCCAPTPTCGNGIVDGPEEECDDGNLNETDDCLNSCSWRIPNAHGATTCN